MAKRTDHPVAGYPKVGKRRAGAIEIGTHLNCT